MHEYISHWVLQLFWHLRSFSSSSLLLLLCLLFLLLCLFFLIHFLFVCFFVSCRIGYMKQPGRLSLAQSHICARGCRRSDASEPPGELLSLVKKRLVSAGLSPPCWHHYKIATDSHRNKQVRQNSHLLFIYAPQCDFCRVRLCPN